MRGISGLQGGQGERGERGSIGTQGVTGNPGVTGILVTSERDLERTKTAVVICPGDSYLHNGGTRAVVGSLINPEWILYDDDQSGPTAWWLGFAGTWVDVSDPPANIPWQVQTYGLCIDRDFVSD